LLKYHSLKFLFEELYFQSGWNLIVTAYFVWLIQQRNLRHIADLYGSEISLQAVEEYRRVSGMQSICSSCFKAARITAILIDDGLQLDKKHDIEWHKSSIPFVGRILRIERLAEEILDEVRYQHKITFSLHYHDY